MAVLEKRKRRDAFALHSFRGVLYLVNAMAVVLVVVLLVKAKPLLFAVPLAELVGSSSWHPLQGRFGFLPFIAGSVGVTAIAMVLALPVCLLSAVYIAEYASRRVRETARFLIDLMAGIPSVIYGLFGVILVVPLVRALGSVWGVETTGYSLLAGGIILAIMVMPLIISVSAEVLLNIPREARESALALGATQWETVQHVILKLARRGILAAVVLGFARAFGETMAVMMVAGNVASIPSSIFDPAYPLPALIANNYGEMMSIPLYDSALLLAALILMVVVGAGSLAAHLTLVRSYGRTS